MTEQLDTLIDRARKRGPSHAEIQRASENERFSPEVRARLKVSTIQALANINVINERIGGNTRIEEIRQRVRNLVESGELVRDRIRKLYALLDELNAANGDNVACRRGCAHCCHIQVALTQTEADMIGIAIRRTPRRVARLQDPREVERQEGAYGYHTPCPFLKNNECSIYEHRPLACRSLVNADIDDLLCRLTEPPGPPVPYLDRVDFDVTYVKICGSPKTADIREYFPPRKEVPPPIE